MMECRVVFREAQVKPLAGMFADVPPTDP